MDKIPCVLIKLETGVDYVFFAKIMTFESVTHFRDHLYSCTFRNPHTLRVTSSDSDFSFGSFGLDFHYFIISLNLVY